MTLPLWKTKMAFRDTYIRAYADEHKKKMRAARVAGLACNPSADLVEAIALKVVGGDGSTELINGALLESVIRLLKEKEARLEANKCLAGR